MLEGLLGVVGRLSERQPVLLVVEDLHDADAATRAFVSFMSRIRRDHRVCLIGTRQPDELTRDHPLNRTLAEIPAAADRGPARITIPPFDRFELAELVQAIEGERPTASALVLVADRARGLPLVAEELLAARRELSDTALDGLVRRHRHRPAGPQRARSAGGSCGCSPSPAGRWIATSWPRRRRLRAHRRSPPATVVDPAAAGRRRPLDPDLAAGLEEALTSGVLVEEESGIAFRHEHIRRAAATDLLPRLRHRHHLALAAGLVAHPSEAASHWLAAHVPDRAFAAAVDAAGRAEAAHAPEDALEALELALGLVDPSSRAIGAVAGRRRDQERSTGDAIRAVATPLQLRAAESALRRRAAAPAPSRTSRRSSGRSTSAATGWRSACSTSGSGGYRARRRRPDRRPRRARAGGRPRPRRADRRAGDGRRRRWPRRRCSTARSPARSSSPATRCGSARRAGRAGEAIVVHATTTLGVALGWGDAPEAGVALLEEARGLAERAGDADELFRVYANLTTVLDLVGRRREAVEIAYEGIEGAAGGPGSRPSTATSCGPTPRTRCTSSAAGRSRAQSARPRWSGVPAGVAFVRPIDSLAVVEIETQRRRGRRSAARPDARRARDGQRRAARGPDLPRRGVARAVAGRPRRCGRAAGRGWELVKDSGDWSLLAKMAATVAEVDSMAAADAGSRRDLATLATIRGPVAERRPGGDASDRAVRRRPDDRLPPRGRRLARPRDGPPGSARGPRRPRRLGPAGGRLATSWRTRTRWRRRAGARRRRSSPAVMAGRAAAGPGPRSRRRRGSPSHCPPDPSCARSASSPAGR